MKKLFDVLPGPLPVRALIVFVLLIVALVLLGLVFEAAGDLLDNGGTIG